MAKDRIRIKAIAAATALALMAGACTVDEDTTAESERAVNFAESSDFVGVYAEESLQAPNGAPYADVFFDNPGVNQRIDTRDDFESTFALDVDTASFSITRAWINDGYLIDNDAVRVEEFINSFDYDYAAPTDNDFAVYIDGGPTPFVENDSYQLVRVGIQSRVVADEERPLANLTFVVDVSGSMEQELPKVQQAMVTMLKELEPQDQVAIVTYGSKASVLLEPTAVSQEAEIVRALRQLQVDGSTNAEEGLRLGYELANQQLDGERVNRVILLSDGVANVGATDSGSILETISDAADDVQLLTVGFGSGNYNDVMMERLANDGDGFYVYVDSAKEAERVFSEDLTGTLLTIAKDAKVQISFNPETVERYRLIGFENRAINDDDFEKDVDAGEIGAGHSVTAVYEVRLADTVEGSDEVFDVDLRWKSIEADEDQRLVTSATAVALAGSWDDTEDEFKLATVVATWAEVLRESPYATGDSAVDLETLVSEVNDLADAIDTDEVDELSILINSSVELLAER